MLQAAAKADVEETADPSLAGKFEAPCAEKAELDNGFAAELLGNLQPTYIYTL